MPDIAKCKHSECEKSKECYRFASEFKEDDCYIEFQNICKSPAYKWLFPIKEYNVVKKEDI